MGLLSSPRQANSQFYTYIFTMALIINEPQLLEYKTAHCTKLKYTYIDFVTIKIAFQK